MANIEIDFLAYADLWWVHKERVKGTYKGEKYYYSPITIGYADTYEEALEMKRRFE